MSLTFQPKFKITTPHFKNITEVSISFLDCKSRKYDFSNLNIKSETNFRETLSQKLSAFKNSVPKEIILKDFVSLFESDVKAFHSEYQKKYEKRLKSFEICFRRLLQKSKLQLRGGKKCPVLKLKNRKVCEYGFSKRERLLSPAYFACLLEGLIYEIDSEMPCLIKQEVAKRLEIKTPDLKNPFAFWTAVYGKDGKLPRNAKRLLERRTALKFKVRRFNDRLRNKKWALNLKNRRLTKRVKKQNKKSHKKEVIKSINDPVVEMC